MKNRELVLVPGFHGPAPELPFVYSVIEKLRDTGYSDYIKLIGSRSHGKWLSTENYETCCRSLPTHQYRSWYKRLNGLAHDLNLIAIEIPSLVNYLESNTPQIIDFLEPLSCPASDYDLLVSKFSPKMSRMYVDDILDQNVDIHWEGKFK